MLRGRSDGSAVLQSDFAAYRLGPGSREFEKFVTTPFPGSLISYPVDDRFFAQSGSTGAISDSEGAWTTFDLGSPKRAGFVLAGKDL